MRAVDLIRRKRDGGSLSAAEIRFLVDGIATGAVPEYQWAALLMAVVWRGMEADETAADDDGMCRCAHRFKKQGRSAFLPDRPLGNRCLSLTFSF